MFSAFAACTGRGVFASMAVCKAERREVRVSWPPGIGGTSPVRTSIAFPAFRSAACCAQKVCATEGSSGGAFAEGCGCGCTGVWGAVERTGVPGVPRTPERPVRRPARDRERSGVAPFRRRSIAWRFSGFPHRLAAKAIVSNCIGLRKVHVCLALIQPRSQRGGDAVRAWCSVFNSAIRRSRCSGVGRRVVVVAYFPVPTQTCCSRNGVPRRPRMPILPPRVYWGWSLRSVSTPWQNCVGALVVRGAVAAMPCRGKGREDQRYLCGGEARRPNCKHNDVFV